MTAAGSWRDAVDDIPPTVLVLGGFLTSPPFYGPLRARLLRRGAATVVVANVWTFDWLLTPVRGLGPIVGRAMRALTEAGAASAHGPSRGAPVLIVGHSAGGIVGRILTAETQFDGRPMGLAAQIGAIVSLGSPHHVESSRYAGRRVGDVAAQFADRVVPGAAFDPCVGYVTVASKMVVGRPDGNGRERVAYRLYQGLLHEPGARAIEGDGVVPVRSALLDGARQVILDDIVHGQAAGRPWYGADRGLDRWWPEALAAWRAALGARSSGPCEGLSPGRRSAP